MDRNRDEMAVMHGMTTEERREYMRELLTVKPQAQEVCRACGTVKYIRTRKPMGSPSERCSECFQVFE